MNAKIEKIELSARLDVSPEALAVAMKGSDRDSLLELIKQIDLKQHEWNFTLGLSQFVLELLIEFAMEEDNEVMGQAAKNLLSMVVEIDYVD